MKTESYNHWDKNPKLIKKFLEQKNNYELLCQEVSYILKKEINKKGLDISRITFRVKALDSFIEKINRKSYTEPFKEMNDLAGVRLVYLYKSDLSEIEKIIRDNFEVIESEDKLQDKGDDKFGYLAIHFLIKLNDRNIGARYDDLKKLTCEVQVRTIVQDAWAEISHNLTYKREDEIPKEIRRKLNALAGGLEINDNEFDRIKEFRKKYIDNIIIEKNNKEEQFLNNEINLDTFKAFLLWKIPEYPLERYEDELSLFLHDFKKRYRSLKDLNIIYDETDKKTLGRIRDRFIQTVKEHEKWSSSLELSMTLAMKDGNYLKGYSPKTITIVEEEVKR